MLTGLKALGVSTLGLSIDTSSVGEDDVLGDEHSVSFFSGLTREGVEFRTARKSQKEKVNKDEGQRFTNSKATAFVQETTQGETFFHQGLK